MTIYLSPFSILLPCSLMISSWLIFSAPLHAINTVIMVFIPALLLLLIVRLITRHWASIFRLPVSKRTLWALWLATLVIMVSIPAFTYFCAIARVDQALKQLEIDAVLVERRVYLVDEFSDIGDVRRVTAIYRVREPLNEVEKKLRETAATLPGWKVWHLPGKRNGGVREVIGIYCQPAHAISLDEDSLLFITYRYASSWYTGCYLP